MKRVIFLLVLTWLMPKTVVAAGLDASVFSSEATYSAQINAVITNSVTQLKTKVKSPQITTSGKIQILLYAGSTISAAVDVNDGIADEDVFDLGLVSPATVTCPTNTSEFTFSVPEVIPALTAQRQFHGGYYHVINCPFSYNGPVPHNTSTTSANISYTNTNHLITIDQVINPLLNQAHYDSSDIYAPVWVLLTDTADQPLGSNVSSVTVNQAVALTAQIAPQISFTLAGIPINTPACDATTHQTTTGAQANFGIVKPNIFTDIAQKISITSNIPNGYIVTITSDDQMRTTSGGGIVACTNGGDGNDACLPNARVASMSATTAQPWTSASNSGVAYTQELITGDDANLLTFTSADGYRHFPDQQQGELVTPIIATTTGRTSESFVCYRLSATPTNLDGAYTNAITYTATATF